MTPVPYESWNLTSLIASRVHLATHSLLSTFIATARLIAAEQMAPIASGLILAVTVLSAIWISHLHLVPLPDPWGSTVGLIAGGILICSLLIGRVTKRRAVPHGPEAFNGEALDSASDMADPEIEIMVRLTHCGAGILGTRKCIVTIRYASEEAQTAEHGIKKSSNDDGRRYAEVSRKLPFWINR